MADLSPYLLFTLVVAVVGIGFVFAAVEAYRKDLMAKGRLVLILIGMIFVVALIAFYLLYVLGPAATSMPAQ